MSAISPSTQRRRQDLWIGIPCGVAVGVALLGVALATSPRIALAAVPAGLAAVAIFFRPELGLYALALLTPVERLGRLTDDSATLTISLMRIAGIAVFAVYGLHFLVKRQRPHLPIEALLLGAYVALIAASTLWTSDPTASKRGFGLWAGNWLFFVLIVNAVTSRKMARRMVALALLSSTLTGVYGLYQWRQGATYTEEQGQGLGIMSTETRFQGVLVDRSEIGTLGARQRLAGPTSHPTVYAANLLAIIPLGVFLLHRCRRAWQALPVVAALGLLTVSLLLTGTRAAILGAGAMGVGLVAFKLIPIRAWTLSLAAAGLVTLYVAAPPEVTERILNIEQYSFEKSGTLRLRMAYWRAGIQTIRDNFVLGAGYSNFHEVPKRIPDLSPEATTIHNFVIQAFAELGVVGFTLFFAFLGLCMRNLRRAHRAFRARGRPDDALLAAAIGTATLGLVVLGMSCDWHHFPMKIWWMTIALGLVLRRIAEGELEEVAPEPILPVDEPVARALAPAAGRLPGGS